MSDAAEQAAQAARGRYGQYELLERIGEGGMAEVFRARLPGVAGFEKIVVVKRILPHLAKVEEFVQMFVNEAKLAAKIQHQNVVQVFELGQVDGTLFISMEYVQGVDLRKLMASAHDLGLMLPTWFALHVIKDVLTGLAHAHELCDSEGQPLKVVHRDVTPANVFVSYQGEVKLADFGIAKAVGETVDTEAGQIKGNVGYMAPESLLGEPVDARADVFSAGVVLWECIACQRCFRGKSNFETARMICEGEREPPSRYNPQVSPAVDVAILRALHEEPDRRLESAREFQILIADSLARLKPRLLQSDVREVVSILLGKTPPPKDFPTRANARALIRSQEMNPLASPSADRLPKLKELSPLPPLFVDPNLLTSEFEVAAAPDVFPLLATPPPGDAEGTFRDRPTPVPRPPSKIAFPAPSKIVPPPPSPVATPAPPGMELTDSLADFFSSSDAPHMVRSFGSDKSGPPLYLRDPAGRTQVISGYDELVRTGKTGFTEISEDQKTWTDLRTFSTLAGVDCLNSDSSALRRVTLVGRLEKRNLVSVFDQLTNELCTGRLVIMESRQGEVQRREVEMVRGAPTFVFADDPALQLPVLLVRHKIVQPEQLDQLLREILRRKTPILDLISWQAFVDINRYWPLLMRDRLAELFSWRSGRFAFDAAAELRSSTPFARSLLPVLIDAVHRGYTQEALEAALGPRLNAKLRRTDAFELTVEALGLRDKQAGLAQRLVQKRPLVQLLKKYPSDSQALTVLAFILCELGALVEARD